MAFSQTEDSLLPSHQRGRRTKRQASLGLRVALLGSFLATCSVVHYAFDSNPASFLSDVEADLAIANEPAYFEETNEDKFRRKLFSSEDDEYTDDPLACRGFETRSCKVLPSKDRWMLVLVVGGLIYLFVGIAIVCDELFVPALEIISEKLNLSNDVAGATLMAAGGSAPELATSIIGTFQRSDIGFGTIVGSAVFNVLFVIGMCAVFTPAQFAPLKLTWWPLARDCSFYVLTLATLVCFMWDGKIHIWESVLQFLLYIAYVILMLFSEKLEAGVKEMMNPGYITDHPAFETRSIESILQKLKIPQYAEDFKHRGVAKGKDLEKLSQAAIEQVIPESKSIHRRKVEELVLRAKKRDYKRVLSDDPNADFSRPSTFRAGILQILTHDLDIMDTAAVVAVMQVKGDVEDVFNKLDTDNSNTIDAAELKVLLEELGPENSVTEGQVREAMSQMDTDEDGQITYPEFVSWYTQSEERIRTKTRFVFDKFDEDGNGRIDRQELGNLLASLGNRLSEAELESAIAALNANSLSDGGISFEDFRVWYEQSLFWTRQKNMAREAAEACLSLWQTVIERWHDLWDPTKPVRAKFVYLLTLPLVLLFCLIPDCRPPGKEYLAILTFLGSILMVGVLSFGMVECAEIFGATVGVPDVVMGLTILAAGTSVPDLLSSVIVARQGLGDMAVSSSIGSNIFDVTVGLPIPWLAFNIMVFALGCSDPVVVNQDSGEQSLVINLLILLGMIILIVSSIAASGWKMTNGFGFVMFLFYFIYIAIALLTTKKKGIRSSAVLKYAAHSSIPLVYAAGLGCFG